MISLASFNVHPVRHDDLPDQPRSPSIGLYSLSSSLDFRSDSLNYPSVRLFSPSREFITMNGSVRIRKHFRQPAARLRHKVCRSRAEHVYPACLDFFPSATGGTFSLRRLPGLFPFGARPDFISSPLADTMGILNRIILPAATYAARAGQRGIDYDIRPA